MGSFSELIKSFDKTRDYLRDFFVYGFKVRGDFSRKSARTYDDEKRRAESWLGDIFRYHTTARGKQVSISLDSGRIYENPLYKAYYSKSFTDNDIKLHFMLTDILQSCPEGVSVRQATEKLLSDYGECFDEQTVRGKLKEYTSEGLYISERRGKTDIFRLSPHRADRLFEDFPGLSDAVKFFSEAGEFGVIGNSLLRAAGLRNDIFLNKHNYIVHTLEDEVMLTLSEMISGKRFIQIKNFGRGGRASEFSGVPLKIYASTRTGRRYLIMYVPGMKRFYSFRLDSIKAVRDLGDCIGYDEAAADLDRNASRVFGVSFGGDRGSSGSVKMVIYADEKREEHIIQRLMREKRSGRVEKTGENLFTYTGDFFDVGEMMSWVKSFIGRIVSFESTSEEAEKKLRRDIADMMEMYSDITGEEAEGNEKQLS